MGGSSQGAPIVLGSQGDVSLYDVHFVDLDESEECPENSEDPLLLEADAYVLQDSRTVRLHFVVRNPAAERSRRYRFLVYLDVDLAPSGDRSTDDRVRAVGAPPPGISYQLGDRVKSSTLENFVAGKLTTSPAPTGPADVVMAFAFDEELPPRATVAHLIEIAEGSPVHQEGLNIEVSDPDLPLRLTIRPLRRRLSGGQVGTDEAVCNEQLRNMNIFLGRSTALAPCRICPTLARSDLGDPTR